jgi:hypothetical protein
VPSHFFKHNREGVKMSQIDFTETLFLNKTVGFEQESKKDFRAENICSSCSTAGKSDNYFVSP